MPEYCFYLTRVFPHLGKNGLENIHILANFTQYYRVLLLFTSVIIREKLRKLPGYVVVPSYSQ